MTRRAISVLLAFALLGASAPAAVRAAADRPAPADLVRAALAARLGAGVEIAVVLVGLPEGAGPFREARIDPAARLGKPFRATLVADVGRPIAVTVQARVVGDRVVATRAIERGHAVERDDVALVRDEWRDVPLRRLPTLREVAGQRALRPIAPGATILAGFVLIRRAVEPGDEVTAVFATGAIEITATLVAADGGRVGDVIRMINPGTKRTLRGRVLADKTVEVTHGR